MSGDDRITQNAQNMETSRADGLPADPSATRRLEIMKSPNYWSNGPQTKALRAEMQRLTAAPEVVRAADEKNAEVLAKMTSTERRIADLNRSGDNGIFSKDPTKQKAAMTQLRQLMANDARTPRT